MDSSSIFNNKSHNLLNCGRKILHGALLRENVCSGSANFSDMFSIFIYNRRNPGISVSHNSKINSILGVRVSINIWRYYFGLFINCWFRWSLLNICSSWCVMFALETIEHGNDAFLSTYYYFIIHREYHPVCNERNSTFGRTIMIKNLH